MTYPGGKAGAGTYQKIINLMPPHSLYIEPFLGGGAILRLKKPAARSIGIDRDRQVIASFPAMTPAVQLQWGCGITWLEDHGLDLPADALVYCDPPYLPETRKSGPLYRFEMVQADHERLLKMLQLLPCQVMISGYHSDLYAQALRDWQTVTFQAMTRGGTPATEWLWYNFQPPQALHDYRYLGRNFRERERIKRKTMRWKARLLKMPDLERQALLAALTDVLADPLSPDLARSPGH